MEKELAVLLFFTDTHKEDIMKDFGYVKKISDNQFIVLADLNIYGSGYGVVIKEEDKDNAYDIEEVREYVKEHPEMLFEKYNNEPSFLDEERNNLLSELSSLEIWFTDVYDMQIKQSERCKRLGIEYDSVYGTIEELEDRKSTRLNSSHMA